jgi:hypothetical protein
MADRFDETGLIVNIRPSVLMAPAGNFAVLGSIANLTSCSAPARPA